MGRVARYKKVKSFDLFSKRNHDANLNLEHVGVWGLGVGRKRKKQPSRTAERLRAQRKKAKKDDDWDAPPNNDDGGGAGADDFDLNDLTGSLRRQMPPKVEDVVAPPVATTTTTIVPTTGRLSSENELLATALVDKEERHVTRLLKLNKQVEKKKPVVASEGRMEGESKRAYHRRVAKEARQIIRRENMTTHNPEKRQRKKEYLKEKKKRKKNSHSGEGAGRESNEDDDFITGDQAHAERQSQVLFGDQVEAPPVFRKLPRGATTKKTATGTSKSLKGTKAITAEQEAMDLIRRKVQAQYAMVKAKRKQMGHL